MSRAADKAREKEAQILRDRDNEIAAIRNNPELTEAAKEGRIKPVRDWAREEVRAIRSAEKQRREEAVRTTKIDAFRVPTGDAISEAERSAVWQGYRSARKGVWDVTSTDGATLEQLHSIGDRLADLLDQAETTGDGHLGLAVYHRALDLGVESVRDRYLASRPKARAKYEAYAEAQAEVESSQGFESIIADSMSEAVL
jgi:hypothetical protein